MTANEQYNLFGQLKNAASEVNMGMDDESEVSRLFNIAQLDILKELIDGKRNRFKEGVDVGKIRDEEFANLKVFKDDLTLTVNTDIFPNNSVVAVTLPVTAGVEFMYNLFERVDINYLRGSTTYTYTDIEVIPVNEDEINDILDNPFRKPDNRKILRLTYNRSDTGYAYGTSKTGRIIYLIGDSSTTFSKYKLSYLRYPREIQCDILDETNQVNCELGETVQKEIVRRAVEMAIQGELSYNYEIAQNETNKNK